MTLRGKHFVLYRVMAWLRINRSGDEACSAPVRDCCSHAERTLRVACLGAQSVAEKKKEVADDDVLALLGDECHQAAKSWQLTSLQAGRPHPDVSPQPSVPRHERAVVLMCMMICTWAIIHVRAWVLPSHGSCPAPA